MKKFFGILLGWSIFVLGLATVFFSDYILRIHKGNIVRGYNSDGSPWMGLSSVGLPYIVQIILILVFSIISLFFINNGLGSIRNKSMKYGLLGMQIIIGLFLYFIGAFWYVLGTGVDSL